MYEALRLRQPQRPDGFVEVRQDQTKGLMALGGKSLTCGTRCGIGLDRLLAGLVPLSCFVCFDHHQHVVK